MGFDLDLMVSWKEGVADVVVRVDDEMLVGVFSAFDGVGHDVPWNESQSVR